MVLSLIGNAKNKVYCIQRSVQVVLTLKTTYHKNRDQIVVNVLDRIVEIEDE